MTERFLISSETNVIAVLGAPSESDGSASPTQIRRCEKALEIWRENPQAVILLMGAAVANDIVESATMRGWMQSHGVPEELLLSEADTTTTRDQARFLRQLAKEYRPRSLTIVTDRSHLPRTRLLLIRAGFDQNTLRLEGAPVPQRIGEKMLVLLYELVNYCKDWTSTLIGKW